MKKEHLIEQIQSLKQSLHTMRLTNDITVIGKSSLEMGFDALIYRIENSSITDCADARSKLLYSFFIWFRQNGELYVDKSIEEMIDIYEKQNTIA